MSLSERIATAEPYRNTKPCGVQEILAVLPPKDADALVRALSINRGEPGRLSNQQLSDILKAEGYAVSMKVIEIHRKGACSCGSRG